MNISSRKLKGFLKTPDNTVFMCIYFAGNNRYVTSGRSEIPSEKQGSFKWIL